MKGLYVERSGTAGPVLLLLHGLGVHAGVWDPLVAQLQDRFDGTIVAPDLRGHGSSPRYRHYGYGQHAADVADMLGDEKSLYIAGHSMGGAVALAMASGWYGVAPRAVFAFGTKLQFNDAELAKGRAYAESPVRRFDTKEEAVARFLKVSGLAGHVAPESRIAQSGVEPDNGFFRLAADPRTVLAAEGPSLPELHALALCPVTYACGTNDPMVTVRELRELGAPAHEIPGVGHNPHVENPALLANLLLEWLETGGRS